MVKRIIAIGLTLCMLLSSAIAETSTEDEKPWYPFGIEQSDSYDTAKEKLETAFSGQQHNNHSRYLTISPNDYYMYELPISEVSIYQPVFATWQVYFTSEIPQEEIGITHIYELYSALVDKYGAPEETSPTLKMTTFDGVEEKSVFDTADVFISKLLSASSGNTYRARFGICKLEVSVFNYLRVQVSFDKPKESK